MSDVIKILSVDDHQMTALGYKYILEDAEFEKFMERLKTELVSDKFVYKHK